MITNGRKILYITRVMIALCILLFCSPAPAVNLMVSEPDTCGMECCINAGVCYCISSHSPDRIETLNSEGIENDEFAGKSHHSAISASIMSSSCPAQCAQLPSGFQNLSDAKACISEYAISFSNTPLIFIRTSHFARDTISEYSSIPRAPPASFM